MILGDLGCFGIVTLVLDWRIANTMCESIFPGSVMVFIESFAEVNALQESLSQLTLDEGTLI